MYEIRPRVPFRGSVDGTVIWTLDIADNSLDGRHPAHSFPNRSDRPVPSRPQVAELAEWQKKKVTRYIDEHIDATLRVDDLGKLVNLSVSRFSKGFKASFGRSPHTYILIKRVEVAKRLISETDQSLCEIAQSCGMSDQSHLSKIFKQHVGTTPMGWRRSKKISRVRPARNPSYAAGSYAEL